MTEANDIYDRRLASVRERMAQTGTDLVVLGPTSHMRWLSGLDPHGDERPVMQLVSRSYTGLLMPALNAEAARTATALPFHSWTDDAGPEAALDALLDSCGVARAGSRIALDETMRADFALLVLGAFVDPRHVFTHDTVGTLRARKDRTEVDALRTCAEINDRAVEAAFAALRPGMSEAEVAQVIHASYGEAGATAAFTIVAFGANSAFAHHHTGDTRLRDGMAVLIDTGCYYGGYPSDMTRCAWFGPPDPTFAKVSEIVEGAVQAAMAVARPGVRASEVDKAARDHIAAAGYGAAFVHRLGHGLGLDVHEPPYLTASSDTVLEAGHVFSIEPGIYLDGQFGIRLEDIVVLRDHGPEVLSGLSRAPHLFAEGI